MCLRPDVSGLGIQIVPIYRDPAMRDLAVFVLTLQVKYGILTLAFVGEDNATARWYLPQPIVRA